MDCYKQVALSVIGRKHLNKNKVNQDYCLSESNKQFKLICIADGHGSESHKYSHIGSSLACKSYLEIISDTLTQSEILDKFLKKWILSCNKEIKSLNIQKKWNNIELFGTTFCASLLINNKLYLLKIGDSNIYLVSSNSVSYPFGKDTINESRTEGLSSIDSSKEIEVLEIDDFEGTIILSSDGHFDSFNNHDNFEKHLLQLSNIFIEEDINEFTNDLEGYLRDMSDNGSSDDITLGLMEVINEKK